MHKTRFEKLAVKLGVVEDNWGNSEDLKRFARQFKDTYYVPERLLKQWGISTIYDEVSTLKEVKQ